MSLSICKCGIAPHVCLRSGTWQRQACHHHRCVLALVSLHLQRFASKLHCPVVRLLTSGMRTWTCHGFNMLQHKSRHLNAAASIHSLCTHVAVSECPALHFDDIFSYVSLQNPTPRPAASKPGKGRPKQGAAASIPQSAPLPTPAGPASPGRTLPSVAQAVPGALPGQSTAGRQSDSPPPLPLGRQHIGMTPAFETG